MLYFPAKLLVAEIDSYEYDKDKTTKAQIILLRAKNFQIYNRWCTQIPWFWSIRKKT